MGAKHAFVFGRRAARLDGARKETAAKLDAEDWRDLVGSYLDAASAAVTEMGGQVAKKLGDGLMALFGYPVAQENDAERSARAALSIQRSLAEMKIETEAIRHDQEHNPPAASCR